MADKIVLSGIQFHGHHGVSDQERDLGGRYMVDLELTYDLRPAGRSDALADTIDYSAVYALVVAVGRERRFHLLEALAQALADAVLAQFSVSEVLVRVKKQSPPIAGVLDHVGVEIRRMRPDKAAPC